MKDAFNREADIVTPEHVRLQFRTAGLGSRTAAQVFDVLLLSALLGAVALLIGLGFMFAGVNVTDALGEYAAAFLILFSFVLIGSYFVLTEYYMGGQSYGKKWMSLRVVQENGQPLTFLSSVIRNFFRLIDFLPSFYFLGAVWMFFHPKDKRLGDLAAGTLVIRDTRADQLALRRRTEKWLRKWREPRPELQLSETERSRIEREDWLLLSSFVERLPSLDRMKREALAWQIAQRIAARLELDARLYASGPAAFLIVLYEQLSEDWTL
ncbi:RDD family protein [Paenibacillus puerhi]|uniref:RDD family protein n=1 Tax=Paenibacillus puerhi TaxID=2692622 RepID=UPI00135A66F8|nr:RDD family protein [Paenibacillus puerhi]